MSSRRVNLTASFDRTIPLSPFQSSTPFKKPTGRARKGTNATSGTPKGRTYKRPVCGTCDVCGKEYRCRRSFASHVRGHKITDAALQYPNSAYVTEHFDQITRGVLEKLLSQVAVGDKGNKYCGLVSFLKILHNGEDVNTLCDIGASKGLWSEVFKTVCDSLTRCLSTSKFLLPSSLLSVIIKDTEELLSNTSLRNGMCNNIEEFYPCDRTVVHCFTHDFILACTQAVFLFVGKTLRSSRNADQVAELVVNLDVEDKEAIYYIAGRVVKAFKDKALGLLKNTKWKQILATLDSRFIQNENIRPAPVSAKGWTLAIDRGKLCYIGGDAFDFFCGVMEILEKQPISRKVDHDGMFEKVSSSAIVILWDDIVGETLLPEISYNLMRGMIKSFSQTFGVGHAKKVMNNMRKVPVASVALRHKVAPKKS